MARLVVNQITLEVLDQGNGDDVVFVHGSGSDHRSWRAQVESWALTFRLITYSRRYHWPNEPIASGAGYHLDDHVADLEALIAELATGPAVLVGHSYGGLVSLVLTAMRPDLVRALVLVEPAVMGLFLTNASSVGELLALAVRRPKTAFDLARLRLRALEPAAKAMERGDRERAIGLLVAGIVGSKSVQDLTAERMDQIQKNVTLEELRSEQALPRLDPDTVASIECPTLLLEGDRSPALFGRLLDGLEELLPHAQRRVIPHASHFLHEDNPKRFAQAVESFLSN